MPTYTVTLRIAVPGLGVRTVPIPNVVAMSLVEAVEIAKAQVTIEPLAVEKTAN